MTTKRKANAAKPPTSESQDDRIDRLFADQIEQLLTHGNILFGPQGVPLLDKEGNPLRRPLNASEIKAISAYQKSRDRTDSAADEAAQEARRIFTKARLRLAGQPTTPPAAQESA